MVKTIFVVGLDEHNQGELTSIRDADNFRFYPLLDLKEVKQVHRFSARRLMEKARTILDRFPHDIHGIIGFWDFPVSLMVPLLCEEYETIGPTFESALKCEHKFWSRLEQHKWIGPHLPAFNEVNPFADNPLSMVDLPLPFWLKPVKAHSSQMGFRIETEEDFHEAITAIRQRIHCFAEPFNYFLSRIPLPPEVAEVDGKWCIAEEILEGKQCTQSGYVINGNIHTYGLIDSLYYDEFHSFFRYRYPSDLDKNIERRMAEISTNIMARMGFDNSPFNIEYLYDRDNDRIRLLEINTRISQSHADLYAKVEGASNHQVLVDIVTGRQPLMPSGEGFYHRASKFQYRVFRDGVVSRVPSQEDIRQVQKKFPGTIVLVQVSPGQRLSDLEGQDSYSFCLAIIYMGAADDETLLADYRQCTQMLDFRIEEPS